MAARIGPTLTLAASCEECRWYFETDYAAHLRQCLHGAVPRTIATAGAPAWCPELPGAQLAMAREIVAEAPPSKADDRWFGGFIAALATIARYPAGMTAKGIMRDHGVTIADLRESQQGVPQEIDDIEASR